eukprot:TRINITY_DN8406_c0_g1_i1.p1 TRINITY_DN8406_c0_g1~~TRINITY_DN8406_c0_g1_i1.p1  ORF type:complete len:185 (+),score=14.55 TRINITY_DN8406_c0_g1_i1:91-645(+)
MSKIYVAVGTTSALKVSAVKKAFTQAMPGQEIDCKGYPTASNINEQPVGWEETIKGAKNRLSNLKQITSTNNERNNDYFVSIENGIIPTGVPDFQWIDFGWVLMEDKSGKQFGASSGGIQFSDKYVEAAKKSGFDKTTAGEIMSKELNCDSKDPHKTLTSDLVKREDFLVQAVLSCIGYSKNSM